MKKATNLIANSRCPQRFGLIGNAIAKIMNYPKFPDSSGSRLHRWNPVLIILIAATLFLGCSAGWHLKRAEKHLKLAESKGAQVRVDTVYKTITVIVPETHFDTVLSVQNFRDTITLEKDKIVTKIKFDTITRRLYVQTVCPPDTVTVKVPIAVTKEIKTGWPWWWLIVAALAGAGLFAIIRIIRHPRG